MFSRKKPTPPVRPATGLLRISAMSLEERHQVAQYRFVALQEHLISAGCSVMPSEKGLAVNFFTGEEIMTIIIDRDDPKKISLNMVFDTPDCDLAKVRWACFTATAKQFASKAIADEIETGCRVYMSIGVYAEDFSAFTNSLKAYVDDVLNLYQDFTTEMVRED